MVIVTIFGFTHIVDLFFQLGVAFLAKVWASFFTTLISRVVRVSITLKFTVIAVLKKFGSLKKEVE